MRDVFAVMGLVSSLVLTGLLTVVSPSAADSIPVPPGVWRGDVIAWNLLNMTIAVFILFSGRAHRETATGK